MKADMTKGMRVVTSTMLLAVLLGSAGCRAEMSDARRDHVLAGDHGWIDLTLTAAPKTALYDPKKSCLVSFSSGGEHQFSESADLAQAAGSPNPPGYRVVVPAGKAQGELRLDACLPQPLVVTLPLDVAKDHLVRVVFDGAGLVLQGSTPYEPTTLEWVRGEMLTLRAANDTSTAAVSLLTTLAVASLALNVVALLAFMLVRWQRQGTRA
jgi:hypothetical protein